MINTKDIEVFVKDLKNVEMECCETCPLSLYNQSIKKRKYSILNNANDCCSYWLREISGINVVGKGCGRVLEETIKYFTKTLPESTEHKNKI
ncbi:MAG: hypothetical protein SOZ53_03095 [Candidatus Onthovivens sp.]|nr:hypothetical protein [Candidatus Onthovivens sp.]